MLTLHKRVPLAFVFSSALLVSAPVFAQGWGGPRPYAQSEGQYQAYDRGYRKGLDQGRDDAKDRRAFDYRRDKDYRKADDGYKSRYGPRDWYANEFRRGFVAGYTRGYNDYGYDNRGYRNDGYYGGGYRNDGYYGNGGYAGGGRAVPRGGVALGAGYNRGYNDGVIKGQEDARKHRSYEPSRHGWYRSANRGYDRDYGARSGYEVSYRRGFTQGYSEGYRGGARW